MTADVVVAGGNGDGKAPPAVTPFDALPGAVLGPSLVPANTVAVDEVVPGGGCEVIDAVVVSVNTVEVYGSVAGTNGVVATTDSIVVECSCINVVSTAPELLSPLPLELSMPLLNSSVVGAANDDGDDGRVDVMVMGLVTLVASVWNTVVSSIALRLHTLVDPSNTHSTDCLHPDAVKLTHALGTYSPCVVSALFGVVVITSSVTSPMPSSACERVVPS